MTLDLLAFTWGGFFGGLLGFVAFVVSGLLIVVILIQESKDSGLSGAFGGGGGGGSALFGASMQKDLAKFTAFLAIVLTVCLVILGIMASRQSMSSIAGTSYAGGETTTMTAGDAAPGETDPLATGGAGETDAAATAGGAGDAGGEAAGTPAGDAGSATGGAPAEGSTSEGSTTTGGAGDASPDADDGES